MHGKVLVVAVLFCVPLMAADPGEVNFKKNCLQCHGADGTGKTKMGLKVGAADLSNSDVQSLSDAALEQTVRNGKGKMPAFNKELNEGEIAGVIKYVRTLRK